LPCGLFQVYKIKDKDGKEIGNRIHMFDEIAGKSPNNTVKQVCNEIIRRYPAHASGMFIYGDATAKKEDTKLEKGYNFYRLIIDYLKQFKAQSRVMDSNPPVFMRAGWMNSIFEKQLGGLQIVISDRCKIAISDFVLLKEDENGGKLKEMETDPKTKVRYQKVGHFADLIEYFMVSLFNSYFAKYQTGDTVRKMSHGKNPVSKNSF
jgi:hypothetical protein